MEIDNRTDEIERFKSLVNLSEYASSVGYLIVKKESSRNSVVMRHENGDKVVIARSHSSGHYIFFSVRDTTDNGTIIDFIQNRGTHNLGLIRKELRPWIGEIKPTTNKLFYQQEIVKTKKDIEAVIKALAEMPRIDSCHTYLNGRGISHETLTSSRFIGRIKQDERGNVIFPHRNQNGVCGYEKKNKGFTGFSSASEKGLWISNSFNSDTELVIVESGVEALSHFEINQQESLRYASVGGQWSPEAEALIGELIRCFKGSVLKIAFNNDKGGVELSDKMREIGLKQNSRLSIIDDLPAEEGYDWNDVLKNIRGIK